MATKSFTIADLTHPMYDRSLQEWQLWRYCYRGGQDFINVYLKQYSRLETGDEFLARKDITYNPAFAKEAVNEVKNSIFQRLTDVSRKGGSPAYRKAIKGEDRGVDLLGSSMNSFLGRKILPELLVMSRVGIFVDMPKLSGISLIETLKKRPYLYMYKAEDIRTWRFDDYDAQSEFSSLLLRDYVFQYDDETGLPIGETVRFRHLWVEDNAVYCQFYDEGGSPSFYLTDEGDKNEPVKLNIDRIPFVVLELTHSLLVETARYQIALMNIASSDLAYILRSNYPFYTEQFDPKIDSLFIRPVGQGVGVVPQGGVIDGSTGTGTLPGALVDAVTAKNEEIKVGTGKGRRYPKGMERPQFINPSSEPLKASMEKQEQLKNEIRQLVHLAVVNLQPRDASAESKGMDNQSLENGLSYIGLELEHAERRIVNYWAAYEGKESDAATINYPEKYSLRTEGDRRAEADELAKLLERVPSPTLRRAIGKRIAEVLVGNKVTNETLAQIRKEIDEALGPTSDTDSISKHVEIGILDLETASKICGYPDGTVAKAANDHAARLARIADAQTQGQDPAARGISDQSDNPAAGGKPEKQQSLDTTGDDTVKDKQRGKGVKVKGEVPPGTNVRHSTGNTGNNSTTGIKTVPYQDSVF